LWPQWGVVADSDSRLILDSVFDPRRLGYLESNGVFRRDPVVDCHLPATSIHVGPAWDNHYHWLIDSLPRVFALHHPLVASLPKVVLYVCGQLSEDRARLLAALLPSNVELTPVEPQVRVRVRQFILLPFLAGDCAGYLPRAYHEFFQPRAYAAFDVDPRSLPRRRILVSRSQAPKRRFLNQAELDRALATRGFEVVHLEDLTLREQIMTFAAAEAVVAGHGAGLTNLLFGSACNVLEIFAGRPFAHYRLLAAGLNQPYANVVGSSQEKNADQSVLIPTVLDRLAAMGLN
jgi:capsular polysaccharide biosynthesis protein